MDQALYSKAMEIIWKNAEKFQNIIVRLGTFHTILTLLAIIGKRFQDAGLRDVCIESGLIAEGSITAVLDGRMYNRAIRVHKCVFEALQRLAWKGFKPWLEKTHPAKLSQYDSLLDQITGLRMNVCQEEFDLLQSEDGDLHDIFNLWREYQTHLENNNGELSAFWISYLQIVGDILLNLLRAAREGNWLLHLYAVRELIPWCFAYDRLNYARYLPAYYAQMSNLEKDHPEVFENFMNGYFSVQLSEDNTFGKIPVDQATEVTVNKDTQTVGGTTRYSQRTAPVSRFYLTAEYRSAFLNQLRDLTNVNRSDFHHSELQKPRIQKDEKDISAVVDIIETWINPFDEPQDLVCISTGSSAHSDVSHNLLRARELGEQAYRTFRCERLESDIPSKSFFDPLKKLKLKTFTNMASKKTVQAGGKSLILKIDRTLFGRIIITAQSRKLDLKEIFKYPLGPLPWTLSTPEGYPRKTTNSVLASSLQKLVTPADRVPKNSATIIDGMALVRRVKSPQTTFGNIASTIHAMVLRDAGDSSRVDVVFDRYHELSIKNLEREMRGKDEGVQFQNISEQQIIRQWNAFLKSSNNKSTLVTFLATEWQKKKYRDKLNGKTLIVTDQDRCFAIHQDGWEMISTLTCQQEEADGRLLLHAAHAASNGYEHIILSSEDTDVLVLALYFSLDISSSLYIKCGSQARIRIYEITKIAAALGPEVVKSLLGMHAFTGCDTVSAFAGKGKLRCLQLVKKDADARAAFTQLGDAWDPSSAILESLERCVCKIYALKPGTYDVNELRYNLFCSRKGEIESHQLPPCRDTLQKHIWRANFQSAIWKKSLCCDPQMPNPVGKGWKLEISDGHESLVYDWMDGAPAPQSVLELLSCSCIRSCKMPSCVCILNGLKCTDMCTLKTCTNQFREKEECEMTSLVEDDPDENDYSY